MSRTWTEHPARTGIRRDVPLDFASPEAAGGSRTGTGSDSQTDDDGAARLSTSAAVWHYPAQTPAATAATAAPGPARRLLLIHGFRGDHHGMALIVDALPEFEVFVPDLPGFGATPPLQRRPAGAVGPAAHGPAVHTLATYAACVEALAAALELGPSDVLVGHSFGSIVVAAHAAQTSPAADAAPTRPAQADPAVQILPARRWAGLALFAPISDDIFTGSLLPGAAAVDLYYRSSQWLPHRWAQALLRSPLAQAVTNASMIVTREPEQVAYIRDQHRQHFSGYADPQTLLQAYWASSRHTVTEFAQQLDLPVLLVPGAKDQLSTPAGQRRLRRTLPQARSEVLRDTGHLLHYEKPAQAARALRRFVATLD
ncbi:alpha/beta fold hydrolase [Nesterenkonia sandarakina]|uniref:Alpha-beta hydrolase superfamily lysophospholipase n=1 Tax=Nesterenkonia sandarakina TaxID=272918 RepID=A0A2T0YLF8_9MICC|nr:alpha/beta fold hydrolase [Nesterenkonia sandarakina]PRZ16114.1 alpha-beta hydrolase superfamily lysophospholipase [Nesterenkonia sandarakina]